MNNNQSDNTQLKKFFNNIRFYLHSDEHTKKLMSIVFAYLKIYQNDKFTNITNKLQNFLKTNNISSKELIKIFNGANTKKTFNVFDDKQELFVSNNVFPKNNNEFKEILQKFKNNKIKYNKNFLNYNVLFEDSTFKFIINQKTIFYLNIQFVQSQWIIILNYNNETSNYTYDYSKNFNDNIKNVINNAKIDIKENKNITNKTALYENNMNWEIDNDQLTKFLYLIWQYSQKNSNIQNSLSLYTAYLVTYHNNKFKDIVKQASEHIKQNNINETIIDNIINVKTPDFYKIRINLDNNENELKKDQLIKNNIFPKVTELNSLFTKIKENEINYNKNFLDYKVTFEEQYFIFENDNYNLLFKFSNKDDIVKGFKNIQMALLINNTKMIGRRYDSSKNFNDNVKALFNDFNNFVK